MQTPDDQSEAESLADRNRAAVFKGLAPPDEASGAAQPTDKLSRLEAQTTSLQIEVDRLSRENHLLQAAVDEHRQQMDGLVTSVSWRITSPARLMAERLRRAKRRVKHGRVTNVERSLVESVPVWGLFHPKLGAPEKALELSFGPPVLNHPVTNPRSERTSAVLVLVHVYYPEIWPAIIEAISKIPVDFDLAVSLVEGSSDALEAHIRDSYPGANIKIVQNRGRDVAPMVAFANSGAFHGYEVVLKLHTKRSQHRIDGDDWRRRLVNGLLPAPELVSRFIEELSSSSDIGVLVANGNRGGTEYLGSNLEIMEALCSRLPLAFEPNRLQFPAGSMFWCRAWVLQRLADLCLTQDDFEVEAGQMDGTLAHSIERFVGVLCSASGLRIAFTHEIPAASDSIPQRPSVLAYYLPQYHQIPENDEWWGSGFTDWVNVANAKPNFPGHQQPQLPRELGMYDLADVAVLKKQADLAAQYGIDGFVFYHYSFGSKRLLDRPYENLLANPQIDFPFALCWANETWTRSWDGSTSKVLQHQEYPVGWEERFFAEILQALKDPRYIQISSRPLLLIYRPADVPSLSSFANKLRVLAVSAGLPGLFVLGVMPPPHFGQLSAADERSLDGLVQFPPHTGLVVQRIPEPGYVPGPGGGVYSYAAASTALGETSTTSVTGLPLYPGVFPGWDNAARRGASASTFQGANPASFRAWLARVAAVESTRTHAEPVVFVNAWNEWAEGAHLEPCERFGMGNLEAVRHVFGVNRERIPSASKP